MRALAELGVSQDRELMNRSPAYSFIKERIELEFQKLEKDKVTPWAFFLSGKELRITNFFGKEIYYLGIGFEGSPQEVFWKGFIQPFLQDITSRSFAETREFCIARGIEMKQPTEETAILLKAGINQIYKRMSDIDRRLRGKGFPNAVPKYNPRSEIESSEAFVLERMAAELALAPKKEKDNGNNLEPKPPVLFQNIEWIRRYGRKHWKILLIAIIIMSIMAGWKYYSSTINGKSTKISKSKQSIDKWELAAPLIHFTDGTRGTVEMSIQVQLDPALLKQSFSTYGSAEAALGSLHTSIHGAAISVLESKTQDYVRTHRDAVCAEIIKRTTTVQNRTAYKIVGLYIHEIK